MIRKRLDPGTRMLTIRVAAMECAQKPGGWASLTRARIAKRARCSEGLVSVYLGDMKDIRKILIQDAIKFETISVLAQVLCSADAYRVSPTLKNKVLTASLER